jgi:hypothetical protein
MTRALLGLGILLLLAPARAGAADADCYPVEFYGTYSVAPKGAKLARAEFASRLRELRDLGVNMVVATGTGTGVLDALPDGMLAVPGCGLMRKRDWEKNGHFDEAQSRSRLAKLAAHFAHHPRVYGICLTHEVTKYATHDERVRMYRLAKEYFPDKKVIQYYAELTDAADWRGHKADNYGLNGERETDILFVSLQGATRDGRFKGTDVRNLEKVLDGAARTPGVPVWGQTSINADHRYVKGPETMISIWGKEGENMPIWAEALFRTVRHDRDSHPLRLTGFFWRSLGRFPYDLGYSPFAAHRAQVKTISKKLCAH